MQRFPDLLNAIEPPRCILAIMIGFGCACGLGCVRSAARYLKMYIGMPGVPEGFVGLGFVGRAP